jgi:hypothetical protein
MMTKTTKMDDDEVQFHSPKCKFPRDTSWIYFSLDGDGDDDDDEDDDDDNNKDRRQPGQQGQQGQL